MSMTNNACPEICEPMGTHTLTSRYNVLIIYIKVIYYIIKITN